LTLPQSIDFAKSLLAKGEFDPAENLLSTILSVLPDEPRALHLMGALRNLRGQSVEALDLLERAIALMPDDAAVHNDIGIVYTRLKRLPDAMAAYVRSAELSERAGNDPKMTARAYENIGRLQLFTDVIAAENSFRRSIDEAPEFGLSWYGLSEALIRQDRIAEGVDAWSKATILSPNSALREHVARAMIHLGHTDQAVALYKKWSLEDPDNPVIKHHLAALTRPETVERASDAYIESTFDNFADSFDNKLALLEYHAPELVRDALKAVYPDATASIDIADAGCGTGLCGPLVQPWASRLCGFDLSGRMLARAKARGVYSDLHRHELVSFLNAHPAEFDAVISADTLVYFGALDEVMLALHCAVRPGGHVFYTVEALDEGDRQHKLTASGRYAHSLGHITASANAAGLQVSSTTSVTLRNESGRPVVGWLVTLHRP
jgi:predicted TPR repeat methyltransferase